MTDLLVASDLHKKFGGIAALGGISISVAERETVGVIGPNGSGKTTLFSVLSGFLFPSQGTVYWRGELITRVPPYVRARRGLVRTFQEMNTFPTLTVRQNLTIAIESARQNNRPSYDLMELAKYTRIDHRLDVNAKDLSWGETRLLGVALGLAMSPQLLLLDEPFAGMSPAAVADVVQMLVRMKSDGYSLCIVDHEMSYLLPLCDRVIVLDAGLMIANASPDEIVQNPQVRKAYLGALDDA